MLPDVGTSIYNGTRSHGLREDGSLVLERAANGTIFKYIANHRHVPEISRLQWYIETYKALVHCHNHRVLHCDVRHHNILLDDKLRVKLVDFQGRLISERGETVLNGGSLEQAQYYCPRNTTSRADIKTDLFGLGSTIFFLMIGHDPFPDITGHNEGNDEEVDAVSDVKRLEAEPRPAPPRRHGAPALVVPQRDEPARVGQPLDLATELERFDEAEADAKAATSQLAARVAGATMFAGERDELCPHLNVVVGAAGVCLVGVASVNSAAQGTTPGIVPAPWSGRGVGWLQYAGVRPAARWLLPGATLVIGSTKFRGLPSGARHGILLVSQPQHRH
ncbi:serine threonine-protein kinase [Colletotrichum musicola]|uniref:EKC/KEOPS complex subunit BUD32 n=1 Tax=Colletotrichum musicola TaxID=2175873 RepID=A0A8H6K930_9PEZI|nr:serine threonine-protein kinase [Colletotrichum musicola]